MAQLPASMKYGTLTWQVVRAVGDSPDDEDRNPDATSIEGLTATFTPTIKRLIDTSVPVTIFASSIVCAFDSEGYLLGPDGKRGVNLIATDTPNLQPQGIEYEVKLSSQSAVYYETTVSVLADETSDLTTAVTVKGGLTRFVIAIATANTDLLPDSAIPGDLVIALDTGNVYEVGE